MNSATYLIRNYARYPITLVRGKGAYVYDTEGKAYLDFLSGIACTPLGHCHPEVNQAAIEQLQQLVHTSNLFHTLPGQHLAATLVQYGGLDKIFFCNSGAEANEAAIKFTRKYQWVQGRTKKNCILSAKNSFHGRTLGALAATAKPSIQEGFGPLPAGFLSADWEDIAEFCRHIDENTAAVILEPIQGESGIRVPPAGLFNAVRAACDQFDALLIFDEVQCGLGRTGDFFAYSHFGVRPDVITLAKGLANGLPIGAVCVTEKLAQTIQPGDHGSTFGGNLVACQAALTTIRLIKEHYLAQVNKLGLYLRQKLEELQEHQPNVISQIRGLGLMLGVELSIDARKVLASCQEQGLIVNIAGDNTIRLLPPYIITEAEIDQAMTIFAFAAACGD